MTTSSISTIQNAGSGNATGATGSSRLGKDEFLKLLLAQVANQDPLSPMDSQAFVAQLAQFASVEQLQSANGSLDSLLLGQAAGNQTAAASLVGKDVLFRSDHIELGSGQATVRGHLIGDSASVTAVITDSHGKTVRTLRYGAASAGSFSAGWDGRDDSGTPLPAGSYTVRLTAADVQGHAIQVVPEGAGRVSGVSFANGAPQLVVDGARVSLGDVIEIDQAP